jgi:hypothetical protein
MKLTLVRAPIVIGSFVSGAFALFALLAIFASSPRWDDHLINAAGVFAAALVLSLALRLVTGVVRPPPTASRRARLVTVVSLAAFVALVSVACAVAIFIDGMSFV